MYVEKFATAPAGEKVIRVLDGIGTILLMIAFGLVIYKGDGTAYSVDVLPILAIGFGLLGFPSLLSARFSEKGILHRCAVVFEITMCVIMVVSSIAGVKIR